MAKYINMDKLLEDIEHNVVFTLRPDKPSSINAELRGARKIIDRIQCAPAADVVEVRKAHWMKDEQNKWRCSDCGKGDNYAYSWDSETKDWTNLQDLYCPNCGAKMDGGVNDERNSCNSCGSAGSRG